MKKMTLLLLAVFVGLFVLSSVSLAQHSHGGMSGGSMKMDTKEVLVEGVKVVFQIMANQEHQKMLKDMKMKEDVEAGTTHNITVTLKNEKNQKEIQFSIEDNGIGISKEDIDKLFRIDVQFTNPGTQNETGTGLGLILCQEFVLKNSGKIWAESEIGKGSKFIFKLPIS